MTHTDERAGLLFAALCALNGAFVPAAAKLTTDHADPMFVAAATTLFAGTTALVVLATRRQLDLLVHPRIGPRLLLVGALGTGAGVLAVLPGRAPCDRDRNRALPADRARLFVGSGMARARSAPDRTAPRGDHAAARRHRARARRGRVVGAVCRGVAAPRDATLLAALAPRRAARARGCTALGAHRCPLRVRRPGARRRVGAQRRADRYRPRNVPPDPDRRARAAGGRSQLHRDDALVRGDRAPRPRTDYGNRRPVDSPALARGDLRVGRRAADPCPTGRRCAHRRGCARLRHGAARRDGTHPHPDLDRAARGPVGRPPDDLLPGPAAIATCSQTGSRSPTRRPPGPRPGARNGRSSRGRRSPLRRGR